MKPGILGSPFNRNAFLRSFDKTPYQIGKNFCADL